MPDLEGQLDEAEALLDDIDGNPFAGILSRHDKECEALWAWVIEEPSEARESAVSRIVARLCARAGCKYSSDHAFFGKGYAAMRQAEAETRDDIARLRIAASARQAKDAGSQEAIGE